MDISFFGDFLLERGLIDSQQLNSAVDYQLKQNRSIGQIGLDEKLFTKKQIKRIKKIQRKEDRRFGEIALENSILKETQLDVILDRQKNTNIIFGEALDSLGYLHLDKVDELAVEFKELQKSKNKHIYKELAFCDKDNILDDSVIIFKELFYRGFQEHIKFKKIDLEMIDDMDMTFLSQKLSGDIEIDYILAIKNGFTYNLKGYKKDKAIELFCDMMQDLIKRVAINLSLRNIIVKNSSCEILNSSKIDLKDFDQLNFISTVGELKLFIKI